MKKVILFFIFACFFTGVANAKSIEFCAISNIGLEVDKSTKYADTMTPTIQKLLDAKDQINNNGCEFTLFLGDNLKGPDKYNLVMFAKILRQFKKSTYVNVGDKDVSQTKNLDKKEFYRILRIFSKNKIRQLPDVKKINGFAFIFMDGVNQFIPSQYGYYKEDELAFLDETLEKYKNYPVVIVGHYPVFASEEITEEKLPNKISDFQTVLSRHNNVVAIISGHHNIDDEYAKDKTYNISVQGLSQSNEYKKIFIDYDKKTKKAFIKTRIYSVER